MLRSGCIATEAVCSLTGFNSMGVRINQVVMAAATGKYLAVVVCNPRNRGNRGEHGTVQLLNERLNRLGAFPGTGGT